MSPRSHELMASARECLEGARAQLAAGLPTRAVGEAYYGVLYAARAALSERDLGAKTHTGTWTLFAETFVRAGPFDRELTRFAASLQETREGTDYDARAVSRAEAEAIAERAERFVAAVAEMLGA